MCVLKKSIFCLLLAGFFLYACKKEYSCENCSEKNQPPIANAGPDQTIVLPTDSIVLNGNSSSDPNGIITSYKWTNISGPAPSVISNSVSSQTIVKKLAAGQYLFELKVTDDENLSAKDTVL